MRVIRSTKGRPVIVELTAQEQIALALFDELLDEGKSQKDALHALIHHPEQRFGNLTTDFWRYISD